MADVGRMRRAAEAAAAEMRMAAHVMDQIADTLPERGNKARIDVLKLTADRLRSAGDTLVREAAAADPAGVRTASRLAKVALAAAAALALGGAQGVGTGLVEDAWEHFHTHADRVSECIADIEDSIGIVDGSDLTDRALTFADGIRRRLLDSSHSERMVSEAIDALGPISNNVLRPRNPQQLYDYVQDLMTAIARIRDHVDRILRDQDGLGDVEYQLLVNDQRILKAISVEAQDLQSDTLRYIRDFD